MATSKAELRRRRERLVVLANHLEQTVKPSLDGCKFDMGDWGTVNKGNIKKSRFDLETAHECGYTACALGWAITSPELVKAGIRKIADADTCNCSWCQEQAVKRTSFSFDEHKACLFFGIDEREFNHLFLGPGRGARGIGLVANKLRDAAA